MLLYCGLELRRNDILASLLTEEGKVLIKKTMPNKPEILIEFLEPYRSQLASVTMEETENWRALTGLLATHGFQTVVV